MIKRENLKDILRSLPSNVKNRIKHTNKEYVVLELHVFSTGSYATAKLTDNFMRYRNVSNSGNCIICTETAIRLLED